jgi:hypothetical protein
MSLENLVGVSLDTLKPDRSHVARLLTAADRNIADSRLDGLSAENRFDAAYKAIMQLATLALQCNRLQRRRQPAIHEDHLPVDEVRCR